MAMDPNDDAHNFYMYYKYTGMNYEQEVSVRHRCCEVTILVDLGHDQYLQPSGALIDPLAPTNFINRKLVNQLQLETEKISPEDFTMHGGRIVTYTEKVEVSLGVGGAQNNVTAFVDDSDSRWLFVLEGSRSDDFLCSIGIQLPGWHLATSMSWS